MKTFSNENSEKKNSGSKQSSVLSNKSMYSSMETLNGEKVDMISL